MTVVFDPFEGVAVVIDDEDDDNDDDDEDGAESDPGAVVVVLRREFDFRFPLDTLTLFLLQATMCKSLKVLIPFEPPNTRRREPPGVYTTSDVCAQRSGTFPLSIAFHSYVSTCK